MSLRIISGERRGARLRTPEGMDTRPLRDRVREALFSIVRPSIRGAYVLDAFAGSGAVGLEALSNGADHCVFIEPAGAAIAAINDNVRKLRYEDRTLVIRGSSPETISRSRLIKEPFNMLFLMPPYHSQLCVRVLEDLATVRRCAPGALAVCEIHKDEPFELPESWELSDDRLYGITRLAFAHKK